MPDNYGLGTGIGIGLSEIGRGLQQRGLMINEQREKQADKFEADARSIATKIAQAGGAQSPEAQPLVQELYRTVQMHNALYPPHETPALIARIGRFLGKQPGAPRVDPRATMTPESIMASTVVSPTGTKTNLLTEMGDYIQAYRLAYPNSTLEQARQSFVQNKMERAAKDTPRWVDYISKDGKTPRKVNQNDPEDVSKAESEGFVPYVAGVFAQTKPGTLGAYLQAAYGPNPTAEEQLEGKKAWAASVPSKSVGVGSFGDFLIKAYGANPTADQVLQARREYAAAAAAQTETERQVIHDNGDGTATVYVLKTTTQKTIPGATETPTGQQAQPATGAEQGRTTTGTRQTQPQQKTQPAGTPTGTLKPGQTIPAKLPATIERNLNQAKVVQIAGPHLIEEIQKFRNKMGPVRGAIEEGKLWLGFKSDLQQLQTEMQSFAALQPQFHGARGVSAIKFFEEASARLAQDPDNAIQAIHGLMEQANNFLKAGGLEPEDQKGGMIWVQIPGQKPGQIDASQWEAFRQKYPNATTIPAPQQ